MRNLLDGLRAAWRGLRCRPGDVCWVLRDVHRTLSSGAQITIRGGTVVTVTRLDRDIPGMWLLAERIDAGAAFVTGLHDSVLLPLRDRPGRDEVFRYAVPPEFKEPAKTPAPVRVEG